MEVHDPVIPYLCNVEADFAINSLSAVSILMPMLRISFPRAANIPTFAPPAAQTTCYLSPRSLFISSTTATSGNRLHRQ